MSHRARAEEFLAEANEALARPFPRAGTSFRYLLALLLAALLMVLLLAAYAGLIGVVAYKMYAAIDDVFITRTDDVPFGPVLCIVLPLLAMGGLFLLFMLKPVFFSWAKPYPTRQLLAEEAPVLHQFVGLIARSIGAPHPREIHLDCEVNASAAYRWGALGGGLRLTIGLPLVRGLNGQQFAGVLAHELGHFSQKTGIRLSSFVRAVNRWFFRVVYHRDVLDLMLLEASSAVGFWLRVLLYVLRSLIWLARRVLWVLMVLGEAGSSFLLRQMEYDADRCQAWVAGRAGFEGTIRRMRELSEARYRAALRFQDAWAEGNLPEDASAVIVGCLDHAPATNGEQPLEPRGLFATHPTDDQRIRALHASEAVGAIDTDLPASALFADLETVARSVSEGFYRKHLGRHFDPKHLVSMAEFSRSQDAETKAHLALKRTYQRQPSSLRPLPLSEAPSGGLADAGGTEETLRKAQERVLALSGDYAAAARELDELEARLVAVVRKARAPHDPEVAKAREEVEKLEPPIILRMEPFETASAERIQTAIAAAR